MKKMESQRISRENVRPSSPTPQNLQTYKLSMLDQIVPPMLVPLVLYFSNTDHKHESLATEARTNQLKRSLSLILTRFYPFAGRVNDDGQSVNCNDEGVPFTAVKFPGLTLSDILRKPDESLPRHLLPCEVSWESERCPDSSVASVQVNYFDCGGVAVGLVFWHNVADAVAIDSFVNSWARTSRGSRESFCPNYVAQSIFPYKREMQNPMGCMASILKTGKSTMRRYAFDALSIARLKSISDVDRATRVEVVSALIWKCFMAASKANNNSISVLTQAVNLRRRAEPSFPADCFGNFPWSAAMSASNDEIDEEGVGLGLLVRKMRAAIGKIDGEFVNRMHGDDGLSGYQKNLGLTWGEIPGKFDLLSISSWCGFGLYGVDFGFGKPVWLTRCDAGCDSGSRFLNVVWLTDTRSGDGVEAWVVLDDKYMSVFEEVKDLQAFATCDPSPLDHTSNSNEPIKFVSHCGAAHVEEHSQNQLSNASMQC